MYPVIPEKTEKTEQKQIIGNNCIYLSCDLPSQLILSRSKKIRNHLLFDVFLLIVFPFLFLMIMDVLHNSSSMFEEGDIVHEFGKWSLTFLIGLGLGLVFLVEIHEIFKKLFITPTITVSQINKQIMFEKSIVGFKWRKTLMFSEVQEVKLNKEVRPFPKVHPPLTFWTIDIYLKHGKKKTIITGGESEYEELEYWYQRIQTLIQGSTPLTRNFRGYIQDPWSKSKKRAFPFFHGPNDFFSDADIIQWNNDYLVSKICPNLYQKSTGILILVFIPSVPIIVYLMSNSLIIGSYGLIFSVIFWGILGVLTISIYPLLLDSVTYSGKVEIDFRNETIHHRGGGFFSNHADIHLFSDISEIEPYYSRNDTARTWGTKIVLKSKNAIPVFKSSSRIDKPESINVAEKLKNQIQIKKGEVEKTNS